MRDRKWTMTACVPRQMWSFVRVSGSYWRIQNPVDDRCLTGGLIQEVPDVSTSVCRDNAAVRLWDVRVVSGSWNTIRNRQYSQCLTRVGSDRYHAEVTLRPCSSGNADQRWRRS